MLLFESFNEIESICQKYGIENYTINPDGTVDVDGDVDLSIMNLTELPLKFGKVTGDFCCGGNELITLEGCPEWIGGDFLCDYNQLTSLEGAPELVDGLFNCNNNKLTTLEGGPKWVGGDFICDNNELMTLVGSPEWVGVDFYCGYNKLTSLEGGPKEVVGDFDCSSNPIYNIFKLFLDYKSFQDSMDYGYLRGTNIVRSRFKEALEEIRKRVPRSIEGYQYI